MADMQRYLTFADFRSALGRVSLGDCWRTAKRAALQFLCVYAIFLALYLPYALFVSPLLPNGGQLPRGGFWYWVVLGIFVLGFFRPIMESLADMFSFFANAPRFLIVLQGVLLCIVGCSLWLLPFAASIGVALAVFFFLQFLENLCAIADEQESDSLDSAESKAGELVSH